MPSKSDIIRRCFAAYRDKDRAALEALLADDLRFTSPYDDEIDRRTYFERCWPNSQQMKSNEIERIVETDDGAYVTYRAVSQDGDEFRNTEYMTFDGGRINHIDVYFGATYRDGAFVRAKGWEP